MTPIVVKAQVIILYFGNGEAGSVILVCPIGVDLKSIKEKSISLHFEVDPLIKEVTYDGDATRLSQILFNLTGNAKS